MSDKNPTEAGIIISDAAMKAALAFPDKFHDFLHGFQMTGKLQRAADETYIQTHQEARKAIIAIEAAPNCNAVISALQAKSGFKKPVPLAGLVLDALIEYKKKDGSARSRDKGIQAYLAAPEHKISVGEVIKTINALGGMQKTYLANLHENRKGKPPGEKRRPPLSKAAVLKACPKGGSLLALLQIDKSGNIEIVQHRKMDAIAPTIWAAIDKAASEAEKAVTLVKRAA